MTALTVERLRELLHYDPETGIFTRLVDLGRLARVGMTAGSPNERGYIKIRIDGTYYRAHHLAWFYMTGEFPAPGTIDHKDTDGGNNEWENLRKATRSQNQANRKSCLGLKGARWHKRDKRWISSITVEGQVIHLGRFKTAEEAHAAYATAAREHFGEFARAA